ALDTQPLGPLVQLPAGAVGPAHRVPAALGLEAGEPGGGAGLASPIEPVKGLVETAERPPAHRHPPSQDVGTHLPQPGQSTVLVVTVATSGFADTATGA